MVFEVLLCRVVCGLTTVLEDDGPVVWVDVEGPVIDVPEVVELPVIVVGAVCV
uniref:Uncharacterized protein n=1 Tax=viral metagenome TaxID=1070528 RepID=A0A6M3J750_9ZZZZ